MKDRLRLIHRYWFWYRAGCIFVHVPKAAGTSLNRAIYGRTLGHFSAARIKSRFPALYSKSFVFAIVRNPWDRVLSAYRFAKKGSTDVMGISNPGQYEIAAFESFETFLFDWLGPRDIDELDYVFKAQWPFVCNESGKVIVDYVGNFENLDANIDFVGTRIGRRLEVARSNQTGGTAHYRDFYSSPEMVELVADKYARDIEIFKYKF